MNKKKKARSGRISLAPLTPDDALRGLLRVPVLKPKSQKPKKKAK
jgi:hypothetical protein